ncbi:hypothetical protein CLOM_g3969 [Closterium sp. NIES-68]|nr:hypothetical protein CLOM_g3969 [Closterium sp. NIES-68]GJP78103.1 hypothetical protein CLOP_g8429 [Closterium sp. NIES-67]GJP83193.1 hypothetical protein CLOP_g13381 [Closterium sp. NIES-67]
MVAKCLEVTIGSTASLKENKTVNKIDPYAVLCYNGVERRTDVECGAAGRAVWNHRFNFLLPEREQDYPPEMDVHIWDKVNGQDKYMGFCKVHLEQVYLRQSMDAVWPVHQRNGKLLGHIRFHFSILVEDVNGVGSLPSAPLPSAPPETPVPLLEHPRVNRRTNISSGKVPVAAASLQEASNKEDASRSNAFGMNIKGKAGGSSEAAAAVSNDALEVLLLAMRQALVQQQQQQPQNSQSADKQQHAPKIYQPQPKRVSPASAAPPAAVPSSPMGPPSPNSLKFSPSKAFKKVPASARHAARPASCNGAGNATDCTDGRPSAPDVDSRDSETALASSAAQRFLNNGAAGFAPAKPLPPLSVIGGGDGANDRPAASEAASAFLPVQQRSAAGASSGGTAFASALTGFAPTASYLAATPAASAAAGGNKSDGQPPSTPDALAADVLAKGWDLSAIASLTSAVLSASGKGTPRGNKSTSFAAAAETRAGAASAAAIQRGASGGARSGSGGNRQAILNQELIAEALCMALLGETGRAEPARKQGKSVAPGPGGGAGAGLTGSKRSWEAQEEKREEAGLGGSGAEDVGGEGLKRHRVA